MLWSHPLLIADCLGRGTEPEKLLADLDAALDLLMAGLRSAK
jgi:hypothetical protein